ncbi:MAG TPA: transcriptional regulator, partial [Chloroflexi bacterium]|nr:transcriptional regulator [Chloroflexota bacterium]
MQLPEVTFEALKELFLSNDFARTRPRRHKAEPAFDFIKAAQEEGANIVQDFHESMTVRGGKLYAIIADACAFANTNGGTLYIGLTENSSKPVVGVSSAEQAIGQLEKDIEKRISPPLNCTIDAHSLGGKQIVRVLVPRGDDPPYAVDDNKIYLRSETETGLAVRDEIVEMVLRGQRETSLVASPSKSPAVSPMEISEDTVPEKHSETHHETHPRIGVEIVSVEDRGGVPYFTVRDLRNGNVVKNVTQKSARKLWHQAITRYSQIPGDLSKAKI